MVGLIIQVEHGASLVNIEAINSSFTAIMAKLETGRHEGESAASVATRTIGVTGQAGEKQNHDMQNRQAEEDDGQSRMLRDETNG